MTTLSFDFVSHAGLVRVSAAFASGAHVVLGTERDGTSTLVQLAAGMLLTNAGRVTLNGKEPYADAALRRRIGACSADERLPPARTVAASLTLALSARNDTRSAQSLLDTAGLAHFATRRSATLSARETRTLALLLALSHPDPALLALFEPLALLGALGEDLITSALQRAAATDAIVLTTASRIEDATRLGGTAHSLESGIWLDSAAARPPFGQVALRVLTPEPRRLAARLSEAPDVSAVEWAGGRELLVRGSDLERLAAHVVASARAEAIRLEALRYDPPSLEALAAARAGMAQGWYERERERQRALSEMAPATSAGSSWPRGSA